MSRRKINGPDPKRKGNNYEPLDEQQLEREKKSPFNKKSRDKSNGSNEKNVEAEEIIEDKDVYDEHGELVLKRTPKKKKELDEEGPEVDSEQKGKITNKDDRIVNKET